jgi:hypothetical protein
MESCERLLLKDAQGVVETEAYKQCVEERMTCLAESASIDDESAFDEEGDDD